MIDAALLTDILGNYLYALKFVAMLTAVLLIVSGVDDLFIDLVYWLRRGWRALTVYRRHERAGFDLLQTSAEKPLAIMVPAWQETGVVGPMAELAASTLDYENYHIFVGTYPNDSDTQAEVEAVCRRFPNVHKVVCARPGPTSKADCLNNILDAILQFERDAKLEFAGFVLHDAEDVISAQELRLFNYLVERKDLIQVPVYPFERRWNHFTSMHYLDEFTELHGKDLVVREALAGQVPSAGVGTCFSRRAMLALLEDGDGIAFDVRSLTEDYDIGFRLKARGMLEIFVRYPVWDGESGRRRFARSRIQASVVCVREYFPDTLGAAVRQKARWIIGIVYQGYRTHRWSTSAIVNYFLWRDRRGGIANFVSFAAVLIFGQMALLWLVQQLWPAAPRFLSIFEQDPWFRAVLAINFVLMCNRIFQRLFFVAGYYGPTQALLAIPRLAWGALINFLANCRAIRQIVQQGDPRRVAWDKTTHDFPSVDGVQRTRRPLGEILVEQGALSRESLDRALAEPVPGLRLGSRLVHDGLVSAAQLAAAVAEQNEVPAEDIEPYAPTQALLSTVPHDLLLRYGVLPLREEGTTLVLASESGIDPVSLAALARRLRRPVRYVIAHRGQVVVNTRHLLAGGADPRSELHEWADSTGAAARTVDSLWRRYVSMQVSLGELLMSLGHVQPTAFRALMLRFGGSVQLGEFLVDNRVISADVLHRALALQEHLQPTLRAVLERAADPAPLIEGGAA
ncbi:bacteriophage N4 adsorption protein B [Lysobacter xinjiangensis]|uniref:Bacteriophage N4 adsorption protein B n=1 Tax=Cognatilysobacter xinjiangensis TaxID=546892 RepID=A0ABQ3BW85_9GAMM|nr:glycosyl transferase family protein [Lysobacter xinjiangensis]GGZ59271.1 bacteriophage N4 adsorption protein B [Lysobacter xinjiangensis]